MKALAVVYTAAALWAGFYGLTFFLWLLLRLRCREPDRPAPKVRWSELPRVTVQVPVYNERHVIERAIDAVAALDYPKDRLQVQILDDSDDDTTGLAGGRAEVHRRAGLDITVLHRHARDGYKAGALATGLHSARGEFIAVFDADFCPRADFLLHTVPHFLSRPHLGMVQTRWSHLNAGYSWLTRAQALALDGHFVIEQEARSRSGFLMKFNGSAGVWRRRCIEEAGGWQADTLCEDRDLSYRAQAAGWKCRYVPAVDVPAELVPQIAALKRQRSRWEKGAAQCLRKLAGPVLRSRRLTPWQKAVALVDLSSPVGRALTVLLLLVSLPLALARLVDPPPLPGLGIVSLGPLLVCALAQWQLHGRDKDWWRQLGAYPVLVLVEMGLAWCSTAAFARGLACRGGTFARTPKFHLQGRDGRWTGSSYRIQVGRSVVGEVVLAIYAWATVAAALVTGRHTLLPFAMLCALSFGTVACVGLAQIVGMRTALRGAQCVKVKTAAMVAGDAHAADRVPHHLA